MPTTELITISATACRFNVSHATIHRWIKANQVQPVVIAGKYFLRPAQIENMTKKGEKA